MTVDPYAGSISLLPFQPHHFDQLISWVTSESMLMQFAGPSFTYPLTTEQLAVSLANEQRRAYTVLHVAGRTNIGHAEIYFPDDKTALLCRILIADTRYRNKGLGKQLVQALLQYAFEKPDIKETVLNVFDWNIPAIRCYENAGFCINTEKTSRRFVHDQVWTVLNMKLDRQRLQTVSNDI